MKLVMTKRNITWMKFNDMNEAASMDEMTIIPVFTLSLGLLSLPIPTLTGVGDSGIEREDETKAHFR